MKYARVSGIVHWSGGAMLLHEGMTADDDHPLVAERPDLWHDEGPAASLRGPGADDGPAGPRKAETVERATRAPGERRGGTARG